MSVSKRHIAFITFPVALTLLLFTLLGAKTVRAGSATHWVDGIEGAYGEYLKINNPHKTSLYIASGLPVVIWSQAALAQFVLKYNCGIVVDSLNDLHDKLSQITEEEYNRILQSTLETSKKLRSGYFTKTVVKKL